MLAPQLMDAEGLAWLQSDPPLFGLWLAYASGDTAQAGVLAEIVGKADGESVGRALGANPHPLMAKSGAVIPLHEKLATALRHLIDDGKMPVNRRGAVAYRIGNDLWVVSKSGMDLLRGYMIQAGHAGVPGDNSRLFDVLQDHGIIVPNGDGRAVWGMVVVHGDDARDKLSMLRIRADLLWDDIEAAPEPFKGSVEPAIEPGIEALAEPASGASQPAGAVESIGKDGPGFSVEGFLTGFDDAPTSSGDAPPAPKPVSKPCRVAGGSAAATSIGRDFLNWLISGVQSGLIQYNKPDARIHVVPEGLLLTSPRIFRDYAEQVGAEDFKPIQKSFLKLKLHRENSAGLNTFPYVVEGSNALISGILLSNPGIVFGVDVPEANPVLKQK